jgi:hypothetical protein
MSARSLIEVAVPAPANNPGALKLAAEIERNADAFWDHEISYEAFHARAIQLWDRVAKLGLDDEVKPLLRMNQRN